MRVAHVITRMIVGGAQENTLFTCQDLIRLYGDDVLLITGPALGPEGDLLGQGRGAAVPTTLIPELRRAVHPWRDWTSYRRLKRILREFRPDVVHTHSAKGGMLGRMAAWSLGVPAVIHTVHGAPFHAYQSRVARQTICSLERFAAHRCHAIVSVADAMTDQMVRAHIALPHMFTTVYSGMDVSPFLSADTLRDQTRSELGFESEHVVIGKIARLFHLKGHEYIIDASSEIVKRCPQVRFLFVGDGSLRSALEDRIRLAGLSKFFCFVGLVPPDRIPAYVGAIDVLVHTSLREGLARALPQALIAGKPVVSYDIDGAREVVIEGETGFLLPPQAIDSLAAAVIRLADDPVLRQRLGKTGRARFTDQFRHENMTHQLRELYQRVLAGHGRPADVAS